MEEEALGFKKITLNQAFGRNPSFSIKESEDENALFEVGCPNAAVSSVFLYHKLSFFHTIIHYTLFPILFFTHLLVLYFHSHILIIY